MSCRGLILLAWLLTAAAAMAADAAAELPADLVATAPEGPVAGPTWIANRQLLVHATGVEEGTFSVFRLRVHAWEPATGKWQHVADLRTPGRLAHIGYCFSRRRPRRLACRVDPGAGASMVYELRREFPGRAPAGLVVTLSLAPGSPRLHVAAQGSENVEMLAHVDLARPAPMLSWAMADAGALSLFEHGDMRRGRAGVTTVMDHAGAVAAWPLERGLATVCLPGDQEVRAAVVEHRIEALMWLNRPFALQFVPVPAKAPPAALAAHCTIAFEGARKELPAPDAADSDAAGDPAPRPRRRPPD